MHSLMQVTKEMVEKWKSEKRIPEDDTCGYNYLVFQQKMSKWLNSTLMTLTFSMIWQKEWVLVILEAT